MIEMDESTRKWIYKTALKNYWRVSSYHDLDDLVQDGYLHYHRIVTRYSEVKTRRHIMGLFKRAYSNHLTDLANKRTKSIDEVLHSDLSLDDSDDDTLWDRLLAVADDDLIFLAEAPLQIKKIFLFLDTEQGRKRMRSLYRVRPDGTRETMNDRFCKVVGYDPSCIDLVSCVRDYLKYGKINPLLEI